MKGYRVTTRGMFTLAFFALLLLAGGALIIYHLLPDSLFTSVTFTPPVSNIGTPTPESLPPSVSFEITPPVSTTQVEPPIETATPSESPTPTATSDIPQPSWGTRSLTIGFKKGAYTLDEDAERFLSQFFGESPDLEGWIVVVEAYCTEDEATETLLDDRANSIGDFLAERYKLPPEQFMAINEDAESENSFVEIFFIGDGGSKW